MSDLKDRKSYEPGPVEERWRAEWVREATFRAQGEGGAPFSIVIPPPNVTGVLHIGHALDNTIQDTFARFERMRGRDVLWLPGTDHAGIATQVVVERQIAREGLSRHDLGREAFLERVWDWKHQSHGVITSQLKRMGASLDWSRERFTLDEGLSRAVREAFCRFHEQGLIYRGRRIVQWCPNDHTALSDEEVEHEDHQGKLWRLRYPLSDGTGAIEVATTRPETMLGDTGVAVHPEDERYRALVGKTVTLPLMGREIPIVADERVELGFGTGAVKVTPAHDPLDFEIGQTHRLGQIQVIGLDGKMTAEAGPYEGLTREECRERVIADLTATGVLMGTIEHNHSVGHCQRCGTILEPLISLQWFLRMGPLGQKAIAAAEDGRGPRWRPERWEKVYLDWLAKLGDWCISRQLWWGHRIPVWTCGACGHEQAYREEPAACPKCGAADLAQEEDVLDTWFSSGLWPFSTMGWPDEAAPDLGRFFPTSVLVTGYDIIFFWVVRMVTMSLAITGEVPFGTVYIHGLVRDEQGRKISKSLGNAIDPIDLMDQYSADALRFALASLVTGGQDISFGESRLVGARNFCNKIFNATRFTLLNLEGLTPSGEAPAIEGMGLSERWILSRAARAIEDITGALERMELSDAADRAYHFWWSEFCDWYVELAKSALYGEEAEAKARTQAALHAVLSIGLRLLHPVMPFITEELWQLLPGTEGYLGLAEWPAARPEWLDEAAEARMALCQELIRTTRNLRAEKGIAPSVWVRAALRPSAGQEEAARTDVADLLRQLARVESVEWLAPEDPKPARALTSVAADGTEVFLLAEGLIDLGRERERLEKELENVTGRLEGVRRKLSDEKFTGRAPEEIVSRERAREVELAESAERLRAAVAELGE